MLCKTISRKTVDGINGVSARYENKEELIDLTPYLGDNSSVVTTKSVREPAGGFTITFADKPNKHGSTLETIYGLCEPMDMIEIRMWSGLGPKPSPLPIKMRGFVSDVSRSQAVDSNGTPIRTVVISGMDYGKIWQMYRILYLQAYAAGSPLLTTFNMWEMFGIEPTNTLAASDFIKLMVEKIINPFITGFIPENSVMPKLMKLDLSVKNGVVNNSYQSEQGSIYDLMKLFGDVGIWNELYTEDRSDGVYVVYRPVPYLHIFKPDGAKSRKIQEDAPDPIYVTVADEDVVTIDSARSDSNVANFYWVNNQRFDLIDDTFRKQMSFTQDNASVNLKDYANSAVKYYGVRPMYADTQQGGNDVKTLVSGLDEKGQTVRQEKLLAWLDYRRKILVEANKDNVVLERGAARIKGGLMRPPGKDGKAEHFKAGDYARFRFGNVEHEGYIVQITDEFIPFRSYTATITFERGTGFITRARMNGGVESPWLAEQATRTNNLIGSLLK